MKKYMHAGAMAILMLIVAAGFVACDSKDEPEISASANFVSLKWDNDHYNDPDFEDLHYREIRTVKAVYSAETRLLELTYKYSDQLPFDGYRGLMLAEGDDLSVGFSYPDMTLGGKIYPECRHSVSFIWVIKINKPGKYSVGIYDLGINSVWFVSKQFKHGRRLATIELDFGSDFNKTFKLEGYL